MYLYLKIVLNFPTFHLFCACLNYKIVNMLFLNQQIQLVCYYQCFTQSWMNNSYVVSLSMCLEHFFCCNAMFHSWFSQCVEGLSSRSLVSSQQVSGHSSTGKLEALDLCTVNIRLTICFCCYL